MFRNDNRPQDTGPFHQELLAMVSEVEDDLASLTQLAQELSEVLVVRNVPTAFREKLHNSLLAAADEKQGQAARRFNRVLAPRTVGLAATASALSVALGVVTYWALSRTRTAHG